MFGADERTRSSASRFMRPVSHLGTSALWLRSTGVEPVVSWVMSPECKPFHSPAIYALLSFLFILLLEFENLPLFFAPKKGVNE